MQDETLDPKDFSKASSFNELKISTQNITCPMIKNLFADIKILIKYFLLGIPIRK